MSTNRTASSSGGGSSSDEVTLRLTYAALGLSVGAIFLSILQGFLAYLQFDISEVGTRRCSKEVMGMWASKTRRNFNWRQLRFQVFFEVPVLYTAPPGITVGPLVRMKPKTRFFDRFFQKVPQEPTYGNTKTLQATAEELEVIEIQAHVEPIYKITGTELSYRHTLTPMTDPSEKFASVHPLGYESCTWAALLQALQSQEKISRAWDNLCTPKLHVRRRHTMCYLMQKKGGSWDLMPPDVTKPFAITTICHVVEMISMLGLVWTEFDLKRSSLRAEGNGYIVSSEHVAGLGLMIRFSQVSRPQHQANRVIPSSMLKRLCFGELPSIFDSIRDVVQVGPKTLEITLRRVLPQLAIGHRRHFLEDFERPLKFPVIFEFIAMIAKSVHLPGSRFRRLPNPCAASWTPSIDFQRCLSYFVTAFENCNSLGSHALVHELRSAFLGNAGPTDSLWLREVPLKEQVRSHSNLEAELLKLESKDIYWQDEDERRVRVQEVQTKLWQNFLNLLDNLHTILEIVDGLLLDNLREVKEVLALHFAAMFDQQQALNHHLAQSFGEDNPPEQRLMEFYFGQIYPKVTARAQEDGGDGPSTEDDNRSAIWVALVFRMLAWLVLHEFNPEDTMVERSAFKDSRLPVYIG